MNYLFTKKTILSIVALFLSLTTKAQQTNVAVAIAKKDTKCNATDLGYQVYYGSTSPYKLSKKAEAEVKKVNSGWENVETKDNEDWGKHMGTYMIIISATTTEPNGCKRNTYGIGFGINNSSALKNAKDHLSGRNWSWSEKKHGYSIEKEIKY